MQVSDQNLLNHIQRLGEHFNTNVNNRFLRRAFAAMSLDQTNWDHIYTLTQDIEYYKANGYRFDELYDQIVAMALFISKSRSEVLPNIRNLLRGNPDSVLRKSAGDMERVLQDMSMSNLASNLDTLSSLLVEVYAFARALDEKGAKNGQKPIYTHIKEIETIESRIGKQVAEE